MAITSEQIKQLREETGISVMQCKQALEEADGDFAKARIILSKKSGAIAAKKAERELKSGTVAAYIHAGGAVGAMVELLCETDFVAKNDEFQKLAYGIAMHVAAANPAFLSVNDIADSDRASVEEALKKEVADKPSEMQEKIMSGKLDAYFKERVLLSQTFIKDSEKTITDLLTEATQKFGEKTEIGRFARFSVS